jgi:hypothetical protein
MKTFCKFYRRYPDFIKKYRCSLKSLLQQILHSQFLWRFNYKLKKIKDNINFSKLFVKTVCELKKKDYQNDTLQRSACLCTHMQLIVMLTSLVARRWQEFEFMKDHGGNLYKNLEARYISFIPADVFLLIWLQGHWIPTLLLYNVISFLRFIF